MTDRESVIIGLRNCKPSWFTVEKCNNDSCPYNRFGHENGGCVDHLIDDALELLKEQKPILLENQHKPYGISTNANSPWISRCPKCGKKIEGKQTRYCKYCGQAVKWDDKE